MECGTGMWDGHPLRLRSGQALSVAFEVVFSLALGGQTLVPPVKTNDPYVCSGCVTTDIRCVIPKPRAFTSGARELAWSSQNCGGTLLSVAVDLIVDLSFHRSSNPVVRSCGRPVAQRAQAYFKQHFKAASASPPLPSRARHWRHSRHRTRPRPRSRQ